MLKLTKIGVLVALLTPSFASAGNESRQEAFAIDQGLVEVIADFSENAIYWCGAALFARQQGNTNQPDRIYVWQGPSASKSKPGEKSVKFGFTPPPSGASGPTLSTSGSVVGNSLSLVSALQTCNERSVSG